MYEILGFFILYFKNNTNNNDIHTDHLILVRRPDLIIIKKRKENLQNCQLCCPSQPQNKAERMGKEG